MSEEPELKTKATSAVEHVFDAFGGDFEQIDKLVELLDGVDMIEFGDLLKAGDARRWEGFWQEFPEHGPAVRIRKPRSSARRPIPLEDLSAEGVGGIEATRNRREDHRCMSNGEQWAASSGDAQEGKPKLRGIGSATLRRDRREVDRRGWHPAPIALTNRFVV